MGYILNIETSTKNCSVSLALSGKLTAMKELNSGNYSHAEVLHVFIDELCKENNVDSNNLDAVAVSQGPGSYTGLRIGVSTAKGLCFAFGIPLIAIDTLEALARAIAVDDGCIVPMIDARRLEVYTAVFDKNGTRRSETEAKIISEDSFIDYLKQENLHFLGDGAEKCKTIINHPNATFWDGYFPSAKEMAVLSFEKYQNKEFEDVAYFEPFYLKDFIVIPEKKRNSIY